MHRCEVITACFQEEAGKSAKDQDMAITARSNQPVKLLERIPEEGERCDCQISQHVEKAVLLQPGDGDEVAVLVDGIETAVV